MAEHTRKSKDQPFATRPATPRAKARGGAETPVVKVGIFVRLIAKPGKATEVEQLLMAGRSMVLEENGTPLWFALRFDASTFGIFDAFAQESARQAHLAGRLAEALMAKAGELLAEPPKIERVDILAEKR
jgi:quinol monooxygenase YgiN